jgi:hypothetical protein
MLFQAMGGVVVGMKMKTVTNETASKAHRFFTEDLLFVPAYLFWLPGVGVFRSRIISPILTYASSRYFAVSAEFL